MNLFRTALVSLVMAVSALGSPFFGELEQAYLKACEEVVKVHGTNAFSLCLTAERWSSKPPPSPFQALPAGFWDKLRPRLEAKGLNVSAYVPCEKLQWGESRRVVLKNTGRQASVYVIEGFQWRGGGRLFVSWARRFAPLAEEGGTLILELKEGHWVMVGIAGGWVS
jgi:hypothetical protein